MQKMKHLFLFLFLLPIVRTHPFSNFTENYRILSKRLSEEVLSNIQKHSSLHSQNDFSSNTKDDIQSQPQRDILLYPQGDSPSQPQGDSWLDSQSDFLLHSRSDSPSQPQGDSWLDSQSDISPHSRSDSPSHSQDDSWLDSQNDSPSYPQNDSSSRIQNDSPSYSLNDSPSHPKNDSSSYPQRDSLLYPYNDFPSHPRSDFLSQPRHDVPFDPRSDDYDIRPGQSVVYPSSARVTDDSLSDEEEDVEVAEDKPPEISRMPSSFYRRRLGNRFIRPGYGTYRPPMGSMTGDGENGPYNYRRWGPRPYPDMTPRGYGRTVNPYNSNNENFYRRGYGNQNAYYGQNNGGGGDGCGSSGCSRGLRPSYPFLGGNGGTGGMGMSGPPSMMGGLGGGMWGTNNVGTEMGSENEMGMGGGGMGGMGGGNGPPTGGVGIHMANNGYSYAGYIERQVRSTTIMMYTLVGCIPCQRAKHLLAVHYADVKSHFLELVGDEDWQRQLQVDLQHVTGALTFPYIFVCGNYIGGSTDLFALHQSGQLRRMVNACARTVA